MEERDYRMTPSRKREVFRLIMEEKKLPQLSFDIDHVSYRDGCKVYFKNGGWVIARFSGTEPLLRVFCEMPAVEDAVAVIRRFERFLELD